MEEATARALTDGGPRVYRIPEERLGELRSKIEKINDRCEKLGFPPVSLEELGSEMTELTVGPAEQRRWVKVFSVRIRGEAPQVAGWTFMASLDHSFPGGTLVTSFFPYGEAGMAGVPERYRKADNSCDHCGHNRRRVKTFLLRHDATGDWKQVGSTCLQDFVGDAYNPDSAASMCQWLRDLADDAACFEAEELGMLGGGGGAGYAELGDFLAEAVAEIRLAGGYTSYQDALDLRGRWTASEVRERVWGKSRPSGNDATTDADREKAAKIVAWAKADLVGKPGLSDYEHNLAVVTDAGFVSTGVSGLAASMPVAYDRAMVRKLGEVEGPGEWFGTPKKRADFVLTVLRQNTSEGFYGTTWIFGMRDADGNDAVWFASSPPKLTPPKGMTDCAELHDWHAAHLVEVGKTYKVKATVKSHGEFRGRKQTVLTRCAFLKEVSDAS